MTNSAIRKQRALVGALLGCMVLLIPLVTAPLTDEVRWTLGDFALGGLLLGAVGAVVGWMSALQRPAVLKGAAVLGAVGALLLVWMQLI
ncbi:MAG: hypothetical protein AAGH87_02275 [Pseudomonadota bacterium]